MSVIPNNARQVPVRYGTVQYGTVRYGTVQYSTVRYGTVRYSTVQRDTEVRSDLCMLICPLSSYGRNSSNATNCCEGKNVPTKAHSGHIFVSVHWTSIHRMEMAFIRVLSGTHSAAMTSVMAVDSLRHF